jgi:hypothetical protein
MELNEKSKRLYASLLRERLLKRNAEHRELILSLSDEELIAKALARNEARAELFAKRVWAKTPSRVVR